MVVIFAIMLQGFKLQFKMRKKSFTYHRSAFKITLFQHIHTNISEKILLKYEFKVTHSHLLNILISCGAGSNKLGMSKWEINYMASISSLQYIKGYFKAVVIILLSAFRSLSLLDFAM